MLAMNLANALMLKGHSVVIWSSDFIIKKKFIELNLILNQLLMKN